MTSVYLFLLFHMFHAQYVIEAFTWIDDLGLFVLTISYVPRTVRH